MRRFLVAPLVLLVVACGGTAARNTKPLPSVGGAAGEPTSAAGSTNVSAAGEGAAGGSPTVGGATAGEAGGAMAAAGDAGAGGQPSLPACAGLDCLAGAELIYVPDREWQRTATANGTEELLEADYTPRLGPTFRVEFSSDALAVDLTPTAGGDAVHGTRDPQRTSSAWFELQLFAGGRFVVQASSSELHAEYTTYGSGMPILGSTRGLLERP